MQFVSKKLDDRVTLLMGCVILTGVLVCIYLVEFLVNFPLGHRDGRLPNSYISSRLDLSNFWCRDPRVLLVLTLRCCICSCYSLKVSYQRKPIYSSGQFQFIEKGFNHYIVRFIKYILDCPYNRRSTRSSIVSILGWPNAKFKMGSFSLATWFYGTLFCFGSLIMASAQTRR